MNKFLVAIRVDGYTAIGLGHLVRSLTVAEFLSDLPGFSVQYIISRRTMPFFSRFTKKKAYILKRTGGGVLEARETARFLKDERAALLLTDSYLLNRRFYSTLRTIIPTVPVLAIDDQGEKARYPVAGVINFNLGADASLYPRAQHLQSFIGHRYFPFRKEFIKQRALYRKKGARASEVFVMMGGTDPERQTLRFARILKDIGVFKKVRIMCGPGCPGSGQVRRYVRGESRFVVHSSVKHISRLMSRADIALSGAGVSACELAVLGVPTAAIILADNQRRLASELQRRGCAYILGSFRLSSDSALKRKIRRLARERRLRESLTRNSVRTFDAQGGRRLAYGIRRLIRRYHCDSYEPGRVRDEYERSAANKKDFEKVKWGSSEGMMNRFLIGMKAIDWSQVSTWVDVGSGTGEFLRVAEASVRISRFLGIDLSPSLVRYARDRKYKTGGVAFRCRSFFDEIAGHPFDLVTCIGVLQKCGIPLEKAVARLAELVKPGGQVFVTTKNRDWYKFKSSRFVPARGHHWFRQDEISRAFTLAGLNIREYRGFEPRVRGDLRAPEQSHSVYILATKE